MPDLFTLSYRSLATPSLTDADCAEIARESVLRNRKLGISGMLLFNGIYFLQTLEGARSDVSDIFFKISTDRRHSDIVPFAISIIDERKFPHWAMQWFAPETAGQIVPDLANFDFTLPRLAHVHVAAKAYMAA